MDDRSSARTPGLGGRARVEVLLLAVAAVLGVMAAPMLWGEVYFFDDLGYFHLPLRLFYARCLAAGQAFDWCPRLFCGFDLQGEGQIGMYHPLHLLLYGTLPIGAAFNLELILNYPAALGGLFLFLRRLRLPADAALAGAFSFAFAGFNLFHYAHLNALAVVAHIPWALLAIDWMLRADSSLTRARAAAGLALVTGSQVLLGYPQYVLFSMLIEASYVIAVWVERRGRPMRLPTLSAAMILGLAVGAVQLLPTREALTDSYRAEPTRLFLGTFSLPPGNLAVSLVPYLSKARAYAPDEEVLPGVIFPATADQNDPRIKEYGFYNGVVIPVLVLWTLMRLRRPGGRAVVAWALGLATVGLVLAFGDHLPSLFGVTHRLPILKLFRVPARWVVLVHLATAVLGAVALADLATLIGNRERVAWRRLWPLALPPIAAAAIVASAVLGPGDWLGPARGGDGALAASIALTTAAAALVAASARGSRRALTALVVVMAVDVSIFASTYLSGGVKVGLDELAATYQIPDRATGDRVRWAPDAWVRNLWMFSGRGLVDGYVGLEPNRALDYNTPAALRVASAGWYAGIAPTPIPDPLPRARLVTEAKVSDDPAADLAAIDPARVALVDRELPLRAGPPGSARIVRDEPGEVRVFAESPTLQLLVLSERFHPGWTVRVDGKARRVVRAYGDFMGCLVEPGRHRVDFEYQPRSLLVGRGITIAALAAVIAWPVIVGVRSRRLGAARGGSAKAGAARLAGPHFGDIPALAPPRQWSRHS